MASFGQMRIEELKRELKKRGAKISGRKKELVERLEAYDRNCNFGNETVIDESKSMELPGLADYQDVEPNSVLPVLSHKAIESYLQHYHVPSIPDNAIQMYHSEHLFSIRKCDTDKGCYVHAVCRAEMKKSIFYLTDVFFNRNGEISETQCECAAGKGPFAYCKHIIVLLLGVCDFGCTQTIKVAKSKTEKLQSFHCPRKQYTGGALTAEELPLKIFKLDGSVNNNAMNALFDPRPTALIGNSGYNDFVRSICLNYVGNKARFPLLQLYGPANMYAVEKDHDYFQKSLSDLWLERLNIVQVTESYISDLELATQLQSRSKDWLSERLVRITSSEFGTICKATSRKDMVVHARRLLNPISLNSKAIIHGRQFEDTGIRRFEEITCRSVKKCGLIICKDYPYLGASPDGLVDEDGVLEVKCPYSAREGCINPKTVPYLENTEDGISLKRNHNYYYQIQGQLLATKRDFCYLVIYTFKDLVIIVVKRDDAFIAAMITLLEKFYKNHFEAALKEKFFFLNCQV